MIIVDLNVLIYAVNSGSPQHAAVSKWWREVIGGDEIVGLPWIVLGGFLRLTTRSGILPNPLVLDDALALVEDWLALDQITIVRETDDHWPILKRLLADAGTGGNLVTDTHLAALTISHKARLATCDNDFKRFAGLRSFSPLDERP